MTKWLVQKLIPDSDDTKEESVRLAYGTLGSVAGIVCNLFLFALKLTIGMMMHAMAITADALNNLSDCITCIVSLAGYHMAARPADKDHPFGHGRMEYVISFGASILICLVAVELFKSSIASVFHPETITFSLPLFFILLASVLVKVWMAAFYKYLGKATDNTILLASSQDSRSDVLTTSVTLLSILLSLIWKNAPVDGIMGALVSILILKSGFSLAKEIVDRILGRPVDAQLTSRIETMILAHPEALGVHDLIIHDYGPGKKIGSAHVELESSMSFVGAHQLADACEQEIRDQLHVDMTLHTDPVDTEDPQRQHYRQEILDLLKEMNAGITMHDFRIDHDEEKIILIFDLLVPFECPLSQQEITNRINSELKCDPASLETRITFDHAFTEGEPS